MNLDRIIAVRNNKTVFRDGQQVIKLFDNDFTKAEILNEALNQALVEETGLHIPGIIEVTSIDGKWAIVSEYIKGKTLARLMQEEPERKDEYLSLMAGLHKSVSEKTVPGLPKLRDKLHRKICEAKLDATARFDLHNRLDAMPRQSALCHGDFNPSNITVTEEGILYILDWSHASAGDPAADAAQTYLMFLCDGDRDAAEKYLAFFCAGSGIEREYIRRWFPIVAAADSISGTPERKKFYYQWAIEASAGEDVKDQ